MSPTIESAIHLIVQIYAFILFVYILLCWFPQWSASSIKNFFGRLAEPYLRPFRQLIPPNGAFDISPLIALFTLHFAVKGLNFLLYYFF